MDLAQRDRSGFSWKPGEQESVMKNLQPDTEGYSIRRSDLSILDTRAFPWQEFPEAGTKRLVKVLSRDDRGDPASYLVFAPPGAPAWLDIPHREYHKTVREQVFVLSGEMFTWEYASADQKSGDLVVMKQGFFMDRQPGSIHGVEEGPASSVGHLILYWRSGSGTWPGEDRYHEETVEVPF